MSWTESANWKGTTMSSKRSFSSELLATRSLRMDAPCTGGGSCIRQRTRGLLVIAATQLISQLDAQLMSHVPSCAELDRCALRSERGRARSGENYRGATSRRDGRPCLERLLKYRHTHIQRLGRRRALRHGSAQTNLVPPCTSYRQSAPTRRQGTRVRGQRMLQETLAVRMRIRASMRCSCGPGSP